MNLILKLLNNIGYYVYLSLTNYNVSLEPRFRVFYQYKLGIVDENRIILILLKFIILKVLSE